MVNHLSNGVPSGKNQSLCAVKNNMDKHVKYCKVNTCIFKVFLRLWYISYVKCLTVRWLANNSLDDPISVSHTLTRIVRYYSLTLQFIRLIPLFWNEMFIEIGYRKCFGKCKRNERKKCQKIINYKNMDRYNYVRNYWSNLGYRLVSSHVVWINILDTYIFKRTFFKNTKRNSLKFTIFTGYAAGGVVNFLKSTERMKVAFENPCTTACHRGEHVARTFQRSSNTMLCHSCGTDHCLWGEDYVGFACLIYF